MKYGKLVMVVALMTVMAPCWGGLVVDQASYQKAYYITSGGPQAEGGDTDNGGAVFIFIRNTGTATENVWFDCAGQIKCNGSWAYQISGYRWARCWPESIAPGKSAVVVVKGISAPLAEGNNNHWEIWSQQGSYTDIWYTNTVLPVVVGNVVPSQDRQTLYLFLRNNGDPWQTINQVFIDSVDVTASCTFVGSTGSSIGQKDVKIVKVAFSDTWQLPNLRPLPIRVFCTNQSSGQQIKVGAFLRVTEPTFMLGTWSGDMYTSATKLEEARQSFDHNMAGPDYRWDDTAKWGTRYSLRLSLIHI